MKKNFEEVAESKGKNLAKTLGAFDLIMLGLGAIIGSGVFVMTGIVAAEHSGPAVTVSYAIAGFVCIFVAFAYGELATMIPTSGSVYSYSYVAFGEIIAWFMVGVMILELIFGCAVVAAGWSGYIQSLLAKGGIFLPDMISKTAAEGGLVNLPAVLIISFLTYISYLGTKDSARINTILVFVKMIAIAAFIFSAVPFIDQKNWDPFMPYPFSEVIFGSSILLFGYTGFSTLATAAEECKNPKKDLTIGIVGSIILSTIVYIIMGGLLTLIAPYNQLNNAQPMAYALSINGSKIGSIIVATGAVCGMSTVILAQMYGASRILYSVARDGLLPNFFKKLHPKYQSPYGTLFAISIITIILAGFFPCKLVGQLSSMGALVDYIIVTIIVMLFRFRYPNKSRPFQCPALFIIAPVALVSCIYLLQKQVFNDDWTLMLSGKLFVAVFFVFLVLYFLFKSVRPKSENQQ